MGENFVYLNNRTLRNNKDVLQNVGYIYLA